MSPVLASLDPGDYVLVAVIASVCAVVVSVALRPRGDLERVERKVDGLARQLGVVPDAPVPPSADVRQMARDPRRKIEAIKLYREQTGCGLYEAKQAIERFANDAS